MRDTQRGDEISFIREESFLPGLTEDMALPCLGTPLPSSMRALTAGWPVITSIKMNLEDTAQVGLHCCGGFITNGFILLFA